MRKNTFTRKTELFAWRSGTPAQRAVLESGLEEKHIPHSHDNVGGAT